MEKYEITPEAVGDLFDIWNFIAQDNTEAADRVEAAVFRACEFLAGTPLAGPLFELLDCLRSCQEAAIDHPNPPCSPRYPVCPQVVLSPFPHHPPSKRRH